MASRAREHREGARRAGRPATGGRARRAGGRLRLLATLGALTLAFAAVAGSSPAGGSAKRQIVVGFMVPLTGFAAANGKTEAEGFNLGMHDFGSHVAGHTIAVKFVDTQSDPSVALADARSLVTVQHADIIEGPLLGNEQAAVTPYIASQGIPIDDLAVTAPSQMQDYAKLGLGYASGWVVTQPPSMGAVWAYKVKHWRHVTIVSQDYSFGWDSAGAFAQAFRALGGKIDKFIWFPSGTTDMSPYISQIPRTTQAVWALGVGTTSVRLVKAYHDFGLQGKIPLLGQTTLADYSALPGEGNAALGTYIDAQYCDGLPTKLNQSFANEYKARYGIYPAYYSDAGYTKARVLINTLKRLHGDVTNKHKLVAALRTFDIVAPRGPVRLDRDYWVPIQNVYVCQVRTVQGSLRTVPVYTFKNVPAWGSVTKSQWLDQLAHDSTGRPS